VLAAAAVVAAHDHAEYAALPLLRNDGTHRLLDVDGHKVGYLM